MIPARKGLAQCEIACSEADISAQDAICSYFQVLSTRRRDHSTGVSFSERGRLQTFGVVDYGFIGFRAVDNQVFFSMCSPARDMSAGYHAVSLNTLEWEGPLTSGWAVGTFYGRRSSVSTSCVGSCSSLPTDGQRQSDC